MESKASKPIGIAVGEYLIEEIGDVNIDQEKNILVPIVKKENLYKIHVASDLFDYFKHNGINDLIVVQALKHLMKKLNREDLIQYIEAYDFLLKMLTGISCTNDFYSIYKRIAEKVDAVIGDKDVNDLKNHYVDIIDSVREFHLIQTMKDLLGILEDRDALSDSDVVVLEHILEEFGEESLKKLVVSYKMLFCPSSHCEICFCETKDIHCRIETLKPSEKLECEDEFQNALTYLYENLGPNWKKLARALKISETKIDTIYEDFHSNTHEQVVQMLNFWRKSCTDASVESLILALRSRICNFGYLANEIEKKTYKIF